MTLSFEEYFIQLANHISTKSKDRSTKVGAVVTGPNNEIVSTGYNGFPIGVNDNREDWYERPKKYLVTSHAEENAIVFAARRGVSIEGCSIYITHFPCARCTRMIIQSGIREIYVPEIPDLKQKTGDFLARWEEEFLATIEMTNDCKVKISEV